LISGINQANPVPLRQKNCHAIDIKRKNRLSVRFLEDHAARISVKKNNSRKVF
jgi:hypothetical protein